MNTHLGIISLIIIVSLVIDGWIVRYMYGNVLNLHGSSFYKKISFLFLLAGIVCMKIYLPAIFLHGPQMFFDIIFIYGSFLVTLSGIIIIIGFIREREK